MLNVCLASCREKIGNYHKAGFASCRGETAQEPTRRACVGLPTSVCHTRSTRVLEALAIGHTEKASLRRMSGEHSVFHSRSDRSPSESQSHVLGRAAPSASHSNTFSDGSYSPIQSPVRHQIPLTRSAIDGPSTFAPCPVHGFFTRDRIKDRQPSRSMPFVDSGNTPSTIVSDLHL
jgi:hypothetical protein